MDVPVFYHIGVDRDGDALSFPSTRLFFLQLYAEDVAMCFAVILAAKNGYRDSRVDWLMGEYAGQPELRHFFYSLLLFVYGKKVFIF